MEKYGQCGVAVSTVNSFLRMTKYGRNIQQFNINFNIILSLGVIVDKVALRTEILSL
jgi:hypothetical protein